MNGLISDVLPVKKQGGSQATVVMSWRVRPPGRVTFQFPEPLATMEGYISKYLPPPPAATVLPIPW